MFEFVAARSDYSIALAYLTLERRGVPISRANRIARDDSPLDFFLQRSRSTQSSA